MKVLRSTEMQAVDRGTFEALQISSRVVMESAGRAVALQIAERYPTRNHVIVFCGGGNNGGDGLVVARTLRNLGRKVTVAMLHPTERFSEDTKANLKSWEAISGRTIFALGSIAEIASELTAVAEPLCVDAIFGTGFRGALPALEGEVARLMNGLRTDRNGLTISIDIPSGVSVDTGAVEGEAVEADLTIALQFLKICHLVYPAARFSHQVVAVDIGIWPDHHVVKSVQRELIDEVNVSGHISKVFSGDADTHKGRRGHLLVVGGSEGTFGAPLLSARAALRCGAGLATVALPSAAAKMLTAEIGELMTLPYESLESFREALERFKRERLEKLNGAIVVGPGMGVTAESAQLLEAVLAFANREHLPLIIDADALTILGKNPGLWTFIGPNALLTPHPGEMASLTGQSVAVVQGDRITAAESLAKGRGCWVNLKGARSIIAGPAGQVFINPAATSVLATAGSGDVLAGVAGMLAARGIELEGVAVASAFLHGRAGEVLESIGRGVVASDLAPEIPGILSELAELETQSKTLKPCSSVVTNP